MIVKQTWRGRPGSPLLLHNVRLANPMDPIVREIKKLTRKRTNKTEDDMIEIARLEFEGGLYWEDDVGPVVPAQNVHKCLVEAARTQKLGKQIERGVVPAEPFYAIDYNGPKTKEKLWEKGFADTRPVGNQRAKVMRTRPRFNAWSLSVSFIVNPEMIDLDVFGTVAQIAGEQIGLCERYAGWGRFVVEAG